MAVIEIFKDYAEFYEKELGFRYPLNLLAVLVTTLAFIKLFIVFKDSLMCRGSVKTETNASNLEQDLSQLKRVMDIVETFKSA